MSVSDKSLRNECIIQHSFKTHPYILQIYYPKVEHCVEEQITLIALEKYGWRNKPDQNGNGNEQRTLQDLLYEMLHKGFVHNLLRSTSIVIVVCVGTMAKETQNGAQATFAT